MHYAIVFIRLIVHKNPVWECFYAIPGIFIVVVTWLFVRKKENLNHGVNFTFIYILLASLCAALASCIAGGIVNYCIESYVNFNDSWEPILNSIQENQKSTLLSMIVGRIPLTCLDRIINTFVGYGLYKYCNLLIPKIRRKGDF